MAGPLPRHLLPDTTAVGDDGRATIGGCDLLDLAAEHGTPLFVYDEQHLRDRCRQAVDAFGDGVAYAAKAFLCTAMARLVCEEGLSLDVATGGELFVARRGGMPAERLVLHGNNKSAEELREALEIGVGRIVIDSFDEMDRIEALVDAGLPAPSVLVRITPGVEAHTHAFVRTGQTDSKFGFGVIGGDAHEAVARAEASSAMRLMGLHCHIGSQVFRIDSFAEAAGVVADFARPFDLPELSMGGGLGVAYVEGEESPPIGAWAGILRAGLADVGLGEVRLLAEPGRAIAAAAAVTLYTVGTIKDVPGVRTYVSVDGGMSDNPRPVLYGSGYETFLPRATDAKRPRRVRVVGKHCETGDVLVSEAAVPGDLAVGDVLATPVTGAYGLSMGSNYNRIRRPAAVFVADGEARLVVRRETYDDLVACDLD